MLKNKGYNMENFFEIFKKNIKTERLELRVMQPTPETTKLVWEAIKNENPDDFKYIRFSPNRKTPLPISEKETLDTLSEANEIQNCISYCVYHNNKFIGFIQILYWEKRNILEMGGIWFIKSSWGNGFATEINKAIEKITFGKTNISTMGWQCYEDNKLSKKSALRNGYELVKKMNDTDTNYVRLVFMKQKQSTQI